MKNTLTTAMFLLCAFFCSAQDDLNQKIIDVLDTLRNRFFTEEKENLEDYKELIAYFEAQKLHKNLQRSFILNAWYSGVIHKNSPKVVRKQMKRHLPAMIPFFEDKHLDIIVENAALIDMLNERVLNAEYPFQVNETAFLFSELEEFELKNGLKIGEIGAGSGMASLLLASVYDDLDLYLNELDKDLVRYLNEQVLTFPTLRQSNKLTIVQGKGKSTMLEGKDLDVIFMRDAFHHFSKKEEMIASIYQSLNQEGYVFVSEHVTDGLTVPPSCKKAMKKADIIQLFEAAGFLLVGGRGYDQDYIFKFKK